MTTKEAFIHLLNTRAALTRAGIDRRRVSNIKARIAKGSYPTTETMQRYLHLAGYAETPAKWDLPKNNVK